MSKKTTTIKFTSQKNINNMTKNGNAIRVGYTANPERRSSEYASSNISGTMYCAPTSSGKKAEQRLLNNQFSNNHNHKNVQSKSNCSSNDTGYVYAIKK